MDLKKICNEALMQKIKEKVEKIDALFDEEIGDDEDFKKDIYALMLISNDAFMKTGAKIQEGWGKDTEESEMTEEQIVKFECIMRTYTCYVLYTFITKHKDKIIRMTEDESLSFEGIQQFVRMGFNDENVEYN